MKQKIFTLILCSICFLHISANDITTQPFYNKSPKEGLKEALAYYDIKFPEVVYAQAVIETGNFTSSGCKRKNNLFGLMQGGSLRTFNHWTESVAFYKNRIQSKYKGGDYYVFLKRIRYASHPQYTQLLKKEAQKHK